MSLYLEFLFEWFGRNDNTTFPISHPDQVNKFKHAIERKTNIREKWPIFGICILIFCCLRLSRDVTHDADAISLTDMELIRVSIFADIRISAVAAMTCILFVNDLEDPRRMRKRVANKTRIRKKQN